MEGADFTARCSVCDEYPAEYRCLHCEMLLCNLHGQGHPHPDVEPLLITPETFIREVDDLFP